MNRISLITLATFISITAFGQNLSQAINDIKDNKLKEANQKLEQISNEKEKPFAYLTQALIESNNGHYLNAFSYFKKFSKSYPEPYAYLYALSSSDIFTQQECISSKDVRDFFLEIIDDPKANVSIKSFANEEVAKYYTFYGDIKESKKYYNQLQDVKKWSTVGVFENMSGSGFSKDFDVLEHPEFGYKFTNKNGATVLWFSMDDARNDRWWDFNFHYNIKSATIFAQTFLKSDNDTTVNLMLGVSGALKIWVNDFLVGSESEERNTDNDVYQYAVKLKKGYNRILLQLGSDEVESNNFMVRFASLDGSLMNFESSIFVQPYTKATAYKVKRLPFYPEKYFEEKIASEPNNFLSLLMMLYVYNHNDKRHEARKIAAKLKQLAPNSTIVSAQVIEALNRDDNSIDATTEIENIKTNDPESYLGLNLKYDEAINKEDYDEALKILTRRIELYGASAESEIKILTILAKKKESEKIIAKINTDYELYPYDVTIVAMKYYLVLNTTKDLKKANAILKNYLKVYYDENIIEQVSENYIKSGDISAGIKTYKQLIEDKPFAIGRYVKLASTLFDINQKTQALEWQQKAIDMAPSIGGLYYTKGLMYEAMGDNNNAKEMMSKTIYYEPNNYDARKKLRNLEGKKDLFSYFKTNDVEKIYKDALQKNEYPNDDAVYLLEDQNQIVYPENGATEERHEILIQVLNQTGINQFKEVTVPYNSYKQKLVIEKAEILKKDGSKVTADDKDNDLVFSSLEKNDAIHITYKLESYYSSKLGEHFWDELSLNGKYPIVKIKYSLIVPSDKKFNYKVYNTQLKPTTENIDNNFKLFVWEKDKSPGIISEPLMPPADEIVERLVISSIPDWNYIANWYSDLSATKAKADFEITEKTKELFDGKNNLSDLQKAKIIYDFIEENFNYSNVSFLHSAYTPQRASRTLAAKLGDCKDLATLFVAIAKEAGLNANLVLVNTRDNGQSNQDLPTINFNHCIAQLHIGEKSYLVELTNKYLPFGTLPYYLLNADGLYIPNGGKKTQNAALVLLNSNNRPINAILRNSEISFDGLNGNLHRFSIRIGSEAAATRRYYKDITEENRIKQLEASLGTEFNNNVKIKSLKITNQDNLNDSLLFDYKFSVDKFCSNIVGMQVFKIPWSDVFSWQETISLTERKFPVDLSALVASDNTKEILTINIPTGKKLIEMPKSVTIKCSSINYSLKYEMKNNKLIATREVNFLKDKIMPTEYTEFKGFINKINEADSKQLAFK